MISKKKQRILDEMNNPATNEMDMNRTAIHLRNKDWWQIALLASAWILVKRDDAVWLSLRKKRINTSD